VAGARSRRCVRLTGVAMGRAGEGDGAARYGGDVCEDN
jgi:hypothetical protein